MLKHTQTLLGTQYFRPPNPDPACWDTDLKAISAAGMSVIRVWYFWGRVNPGRGEWDFSEYDPLFALAERHGLGILLQLNVETPPSWIVRQYPEGRYVNYQGQPVIPAKHPMAQVGNYPGLCYDYAPVRQAAEEFLVKTVEHYRGHPALFAWDVWNEMMPFYGHNSVFDHLYHPDTLKIYRRWLADRYKTIEAFNKANMSDAASFDEIQPPQRDTGVFLDRLEFIEFGQEWIRNYLNWKVDIVRRHDATHPVTAHPGSHDTGPYEPWVLTEKLDFWGVSCYLTQFWKTVPYFMFSRDAAPGKPWGVVEMASGRTWYGPYGGRTRAPEYLEQLPLLSLSMGGKINLFWQYRPERFGPESPSFGLVNEDGSATPGYRRIARLGQAIRKKSSLFDRLTFPDNDVGLLVDQRTGLLEKLAGLPGEEWFAGDFEYLGYCRALVLNGARTQLLFSGAVARKEVPAHIKLLIVPLITVEQPGLAEALAAFAARGGHLLCGPYLFLYDAQTYMHADTPPRAMQALFGCRRIELRLDHLKNMELKRKGARSATAVVGHHALEVYECAGARPWLVHKRAVVGTCHQVGASWRYKVGSLLGTAPGKMICWPDRKDLRVPDAGLLAMLKEILDRAGCLREPSATGEVVVRLGRSGNDRLLFVHNALERSQATKIDLPEPASGAEDVLVERPVALQGRRRISISLAARESKIVRLFS